MVKVIPSVIIAIGLLGAGVFIGDGVSRISATTQGVVLDDGEVVIFHRGRVRWCTKYDGGLVGCSDWSR